MTLNKFQLGDTVVITAKIKSIQLEDDGKITYEVETSEYTHLIVQEDELSIVF